MKETRKPLVVIHLDAEIADYGNTAVITSRYEIGTELWRSRKCVEIEKIRSFGVAAMVTPLVRMLVSAARAYIDASPIAPVEIVVVDRATTACMAILEGGRMKRRDFLESLAVAPAAAALPVMADGLLHGELGMP